MKTYQQISLHAVACAAISIGVMGCQDSTSVDAQDPVVVESETTLNENVEELKRDAGEAIDDAADAVTPDRSIVDIDTPLADVDVSEDRATGRNKVEVESK